MNPGLEDKECLKNQDQSDNLLAGVEVLVDAQGLSCPMPLLKAKQALHRCELGQSVGVIATDTGALRDIPAFCALVGHQVILAELQGQTYRFVIKKGAV